MRHGKKINHLGRKSAHRKSMLANLASSLILHKRIETTLAKGKALRTFIEPLITKAKEDSTHSRRMVFSYLQSKEAVSTLFRDVSIKVADRPGGYTRILKTGNRMGDNAEMCLIELVDYNENLLGTKQESKAKSTRRRRSAGKKKAEPSTEMVTQQAAKQPAPAASPEPVSTEEPMDGLTEEITDQDVNDEPQPDDETKS